MAQGNGIPERFLPKLLKPLVNARILRSRRGPGGGYTLARPPKDVTLLEVIEEIDGPLLGLAPPLGKAGGALDLRLKAVCDEAASLVRARLAGVTLADLARGK